MPVLSAPTLAAFASFWRAREESKGKAEQIQFEFEAELKQSQQEYQDKKLDSLDGQSGSSRELSRDEMNLECATNESEGWN